MYIILHGPHSPLDVGAVMNTFLQTGTFEHQCLAWDHIASK